VKRFLVTLISTGLYSGFLKPFPGTWGTIPAWLIAYFLIGGNYPVLCVVTMATFLVSIWASGQGERYFGHDARKIVIDEWVGMFIAVLFVPYTIYHYAAAFLAFRAFDVIKLWPAEQFESLPGGWGITMDDVAAGIQANVFVQIMIYAIQHFS
jgi:phosphatidylglycerophosphatase A